MTCIFILRNINQSYAKQHIFNPDSSQIERAYRLSTEVLGKTHFTTNSARDYYYKYLIFTENYAPAIPVVKEIIELEINSTNDAYQLKERYKQLYALEGLTENWPAEEAALHMVMKLARDVLGERAKILKPQSLYFLLYQKNTMSTSRLKVITEISCFPNQWMMPDLRTVNT